MKRWLEKLNPKLLWASYEKNIDESEKKSLIKERLIIKED